MEEDKLPSLKEYKGEDNSSFGYTAYQSLVRGNNNSAFGSEICQKCGIDAEGEIRTLWMACLYEMNELGIPFEKVELGDRYYYTLKVCKQCRADWMRAIKVWFETPIIPETCDSGIYVRDLGHAKQVTHEEWEIIRARADSKDKDNGN
jgi:NMD protein affecting ribosome stability and mRNA decay